MEIIHGSHQITSPLRRPVLTMGNFDGVHRGHQAIFAQVVAAAEAERGTAVVLTFDPHPATVLAPNRPFLLLQTLPQRCRAIAAAHIAVTIIEPFTRAFARWTPEAFLDTIVRGRIVPARIIIGYDFTFGAQRAGRVEQLKRFGEASEIPVEVVEPVFDGDLLISSTQIRQCVRDGRLREATAALGRPYELEGGLVLGRGIGKQLGFPTLNMVPDNALIPPEGVYVATASLGTASHAAATYIGRNPTFGGTTLVVETYLLDYPGGEVTAERMAVALHERLRGDVRFDTPEALKRQIAKDVEMAEKYHKGSALTH